MLMMIRQYDLILVGNSNFQRPDELDYRAYGFTDADLDREFALGIKMIGGFLGEGRYLIFLPYTNTSLDLNLH